MDLVQTIVLWAVPVVFAITLHEAAHGYVARMFGDQTAWMLGRVTLNPIKHIDPIGTIAVPGFLIAVSVLTKAPLFLFGWAKPVPVNFGNLRNPKRDMFWVAGAGPFVNFVMAVAWAFLLRASMPGGVIASDGLFEMADAGVQINLMLMALNLLPILPLDGGRIAVSLLPQSDRCQLCTHGTLRLHAGDPAARDRLSRNIDAAAASRGRIRHPPDCRHLKLRCVHPNLSMFADRVLSGMRPTGRMHIGHYHGALKNWVRLQEEYECLYFAADWHALTTHYETPERIEDSVWEMFVDWLAVGINPSRATIFIQSRVIEHAELTLLLGMIAPVGWLERVPTYKDQQEKLSDRDLTTYGFLGYPVMQAADILIYRANMVPVGEDQVSHLELVRELARRFNHIYGREPGFEDKAKAAIKKLGTRRAKRYDQLRTAFQEQGDDAALQAARDMLDEAQNLALGDRERLFGYLEGSRRVILPEPQPLLDRNAQGARPRRRRRCPSPTTTRSCCARIRRS